MAEAPEMFELEAPSVELPPEQVEKLLDSLDEVSREVENQYPNRPTRCRFRSRSVIVTIFDEYHRPEDIFSVCTRNLSLGGMAFPHNSMIEPERRLRIDIPL